jgi:hypothetical protein
VHAELAPAISRHVCLTRGELLRCAFRGCIDSVRWKTSEDRKEPKSWRTSAPVCLSDRRRSRRDRLCVQRRAATAAARRQECARKAPRPAQAAPERISEQSYQMSGWRERKKGESERERAKESDEARGGRHVGVCLSCKQPTDLVSARGKGKRRKEDAEALAQTAT